MHAFWSSGITIENNGFKLILDPERTVRKTDRTIVGISHAHSDHIKDHSADLLLTKPTSDLFHCQADKRHLDYREKIELDGMTVSLLNANHILGSSQFVIENDKTIVYTGDFRLQKSLLFGECDVPETDALIIESTYGLPHFKFPDIDTVSRDIERWVKQNKDKNLVFGAYALGKSQELIKILNDAGVSPIVHSHTYQVSKIYEKNGVKIGDFVNAESDEAREVMRDPFVAIVPNRLVKSDFAESLESQTGRETLSAMATGWGLLYAFPGVDKIFCLSDHSDFYQLIDYVKQSGAKEVYTVHGYAEEFARELNRRLKINAKPLKGVQHRLFDFW
jgi:putative mRNA 3-end processing factor